MPRGAQGKAYLGFDLGAESGRAMLAHLHAGVLTMEEIHRFSNGPVEENGSLHWDAPQLWTEVRKALTKLEKTKLAGMGVDTWGVDYALLGQHGELLQNPYHYRDVRTKGIMEEVSGKVPREEIYAQTGIQFMPINTLYQLVAANREMPELLRAAKYLVMMPDLFNYWLTGNAACEFTNATTTQMVNPSTRQWATNLMERLELPSSLPAPIVEPGSVLGALREGVVQNSLLSGTPVIATATHDTASAVAAISARDGTAFLSSGTWSLLGVELDAPMLSADALRFNFTNEGGVCGTIRLLKNVMGLWILQRCRQSWARQGEEHEYAELMELANREPPFRHLVDPDDESFLRAAEMPAAIDRFCAKTNQLPPRSPGAYVRAVLESLAFKYRLVLSNLEQVCGQRVEQIRVIGGGSKNRTLNQFTANATGRRVLAGPAEATAIGNVLVQILATGEATTLTEARAIVDRSFPTETFEPLDTGKWDREAQRFEHYCEMVYA